MLAMTPSQYNGIFYKKYSNSHNIFTIEMSHLKLTQIFWELNRITKSCKMLNFNFHLESESEYIFLNYFTDMIRFYPKILFIRKM